MRTLRRALYRVAAGAGDALLRLAWWLDPEPEMSAAAAERMWEEIKEAVGVAREQARLDFSERET